MNRVERRMIDLEDVLRDIDFSFIALIRAGWRELK